MENTTTFFTPQDLPVRGSDVFSVDVWVCDSHGLLNLACYDYEEHRWLFHTDSESSEFIWMYASQEFIEAGKKLSGNRYKQLLFSVFKKKKAKR